MELPDKTQPGVQKKVVTQVASGVKQVKRPATKRFMDFIFAESPKGMAKKVGHEVVVPQLKQGFRAAAVSWLDGMLGFNAGTVGAQFMQGTVLRPGMTSYNQISNPMNNMQMAQQAVMNQSSGNYQDLELPNQAMAEATLSQMYTLLNQYRVVAVADLYEMVGITPAPSDNAFGWTSLDGARISVAKSGFLLQLPRPHQITP